MRDASWPTHYCVPGGGARPGPARIHLRRHDRGHRDPRPLGRAAGSRCHHGTHRDRRGLPAAPGRRRRRGRPARREPPGGRRPDGPARPGLGRQRRAAAGLAQLRGSGRRRTGRHRGPGRHRGRQRRRRAESRRRIPRPARRVQRRPRHPADSRRRRGPGVGESGAGPERQRRAARARAADPGRPRPAAAAGGLRAAQRPDRPVRAAPHRRPARCRGRDGGRALAGPVHHPAAGRAGPGRGPGGERRAGHPGAGRARGRAGPAGRLVQPDDPGAAGLRAGADRQPRPAPGPPGDPRRHPVQHP